MGFDVIDINQGAKKALKLLAEGGQAGYIEKEYVVAIPKQSVTFANDGSVDFSGEQIKKVPQAGERCRILIDDVEHEYIATTFVEEGETIIVVGEVGYIHAAFFPDGSFAQLNVASAPASAIVEVQVNAETIHPIDPKYLPGVCLPVVELSTELPNDGSAVVLNEADSAAMQVILESGAKFIIAVAFIGNSPGCTILRKDEDGIGFWGSYLFPGVVYEGFLKGVVITRNPEDGVWYFARITQA